MLSIYKVEKLHFIEDINKNIIKYFSDVEKITYEVYSNGAYEFLVVEYKGGAKAVRNCTANSLTAILRELSKLIDGGYYDELDFYNSVKEKYALEIE